MGTFLYMVKNKIKQTITNAFIAFIVIFQAPEILAGAEHYGKEIDVFSFGVIMTELLTGKRPFEDKNLSHFELAQYVIDGGVNK